MHYSKKRIFKLLMLIGAFAIGAFSLIYTKALTDELRDEEEQKVELWAEATRQLVKLQTDDQSMNLTLEVLKNNNTVPVLLVDDQDNIYHHRNFTVSENREEDFLKRQLQKMKKSGKYIEIDLGDGEKQYLYYKTSTLLVKLTWFPLVQLIIIIIFVAIAYLAFSNARKSEQNQVWVGMAKETAHQLGTPISSLMGWTDVLALKDPDSDVVPEVTKDIARLQNVADRFSKIGSKPILKEIDLKDLVESTLVYFRSRVSSKVFFHMNFKENKTVKANAVLLEWVLENLIKNAIDAIDGSGEIRIESKKEGERIALDISDNGKGISKVNMKTVFEPGFTTKERGWGLGLTLTKRIVEEYHKGKIYVKESELNAGTTFRILL